MWVLFVYSVFVCLSLLFLIRSQQSVARWELSLSTYWLLLIPNPLPPYVKHRTLLVSTFLIKLCALHPKILGIWLWPPSLYPLFPFRKKKTVPIFGYSEESILGKLPHSFQKANLKYREVLVKELFSRPFYKIFLKLYLLQLHCPLNTVATLPYCTAGIFLSYFKDIAITTFS